MKTAAVALVAGVMLLTSTGDILGASAGGNGGGRRSLQDMAFFEMLEDGETVELLSFGPFTVSATCSDRDEASLLMTVKAEDDDEWVFGFPDYEPQDGDGLCIGSSPAGTTKSCPMFTSGAGTGNPGGFQSLSGYYVGVVGHTVGFDIDYMNQDYSTTYHQYTDDDLAAFPSEYKCMISGVLEYFQK